ncbi:MAG: N-acetylmuramoyl-L-alanine amidase [Phycisphaerales bacterium]|nr:MAG: N-acetylmuramoyl-L-alanine amidase [Phycisphaerales bacterium]
MEGPNDQLNRLDREDGLPPLPLSSRRGFLLLGLGLLAGCAADSAVSTLPSPLWRSADSPPLESPRARPASRPQPEVIHVNGEILTRSSWTRGRPIYSRMDRMQPIRYVTVHHDAHEGYLTAQRDVAARLEAIRLYHRDVRGWGDIGYHYAIDRAGRVWEGRPISWQGAHVSDHNEGNIGVMALGNFDLQTPSAAQLDALDRHVSWLMRKYNVPLSRVRTHREWAPTVCPGNNLQQHMDEVRRSRTLG